jgi:hypothetical protein
MYKGKDRKRSAPAAESIFNRRFVPLFVEMEKTSIEHRLFFREKKNQCRGKILHFSADYIE